MPTVCCSAPQDVTTIPFLCTNLTSASHLLLTGSGRTCWRNEWQLKKQLQRVVLRGSAAPLLRPIKNTDAETFPPAVKPTGDNTLSCTSTFICGLIFREKLPTIRYPTVLNIPRALAMHLATANSSPLFSNNPLIKH